MTALLVVASLFSGFVGGFFLYALAVVAALWLTWQYEVWRWHAAEHVLGRSFPFWQWLILSQR